MGSLRTALGRRCTLFHEFGRHVTWFVCRPALYAAFRYQYARDFVSFPPRLASIGRAIHACSANATRHVDSGEKSR